MKDRQSKDFEIWYSLKEASLTLRLMAPDPIDILDNSGSLQPESGASSCSATRPASQDTGKTGCHGKGA